MNKLLLLLLLLGASGCHNNTDDEVLIKKLLETESATWRSGDGKAHAACWAIKPYSRILVSTGDGRCIDVPPEAMTKTDPAGMGKGGSSVNSNYRISVNGSSAWVSHDEISTAADGTKTVSYEIRMLEKIDGAWKLVGQSIHICK